MRFREVPAEKLSLNPMTMIGGGWWLIGAGNEEAYVGEIIRVLEAEK